MDEFETIDKRIKQLIEKKKLKTDVMNPKLMIFNIK